MNTTTKTFSLLDPALLRPALIAALRKLDPRVQWRNPVMFVVYVGSVITTLLWLQALLGPGQGHDHAGAPGSAETGFIGGVTLWLWFTVLFANFAEALAEGRSKAQAASLRGMKRQVVGKLLKEPRHGASWSPVAADALRKGAVVLVDAGDIVPLDGEVIEGVASVDESAITGESAPVIRQSGGDFASVTGGTRVLSDWLVVRIGVNPGESFIDRMIAMVEGAKRQKTPNEIALNILLVALTIVFLVVVVTLLPMSVFSVDSARSGSAVTLTTLIALLVCLIPTTIGPQLSSLADETPEGRSIVVLSKNQFGIRERQLTANEATFIPFTAQTRMSGVNWNGRQIRKGAADSVRKHVESLGGRFSPEVTRAVDDVARRGSTPLVVCDGAQVLGVVELKDIVKGGIKERFVELRRMGIKTVMITGDNKLTAAAIAAEAGVDDVLAEATPEAKLALIRQYQAEGRMVAMTGDGTNDAPALAQADVAVAMNSGTQAAKEAGNMVDLDSNPTKLIEVVEIGKQMLMTRGALTTFSIANDVAKYFAIIPAAFAVTYPQLSALNVMHLASPSSAILSAVIFNALIIVVLIPLALRGVKYRALGAAVLLRRNALVYGVGGLIVPFIGIKAIDLVLTVLNLV